jgi:hypothetical protein
LHFKWMACCNITLKWGDKRKGARVQWRET